MLQQLLHIVRGRRIDLEADFLGFGVEVLILHCRPKRIAQRRKAIRRNIGRSGQGAAKHKLTKVEFKNRTLFVGFGVVEDAWNVAELG